MSRVTVVLSLALLGCVEPLEETEPFDPRINNDEVMVRAATPPPPISGGTLLVARNGTVWASDPERNLVWHVDIDTEVVLSGSALDPGDEPERLVEDSAGRIHVVLRSGGAIATIEPGYAQDIARRDVCEEPRGLGYDSRRDVLIVGCVSGELVTLPAAGGAETSRAILPTDLRDVVVAEDGIVYVSRFRSAELLQVDEAGDWEQLGRPFADNLLGDAVARVAWRTIPYTAPGVTGVMMVFQAEAEDQIGTGVGPTTAPS